MFYSRCCCPLFFSVLAGPIPGSYVSFFRLKAQRHKKLALGVGIVVDKIIHGIVTWCQQCEGLSVKAFLRRFITAAKIRWSSILMRVSNLLSGNVLDPGPIRMMLM